VSKLQFTSYALKLWEWTIFCFGPILTLFFIAYQLQFGHQKFDASSNIGTLILLTIIVFVLSLPVLLFTLLIGYAMDNSKVHKLHAQFLITMLAIIGVIITSVIFKTDLYASIIYCIAVMLSGILLYFLEKRKQGNSKS